MQIAIPVKMASPPIIPAAIAPTFALDIEELLFGVFSGTTDGVTIEDADPVLEMEACVV